MIKNGGDLSTEGFCVIEYARRQSIVDIQRNYGSKFRKDQPVRKSSKQWYEKFQHDSWLCNTKHPGRPGISEWRVESVRELVNTGSVRPMTEQVDSCVSHTAVEFFARVCG
jgi:hypothetical protein